MGGGGPDHLKQVRLWVPSSWGALSVGEDLGGVSVGKGLYYPPPGPPLWNKSLFLFQGICT